MHFDHTKQQDKDREEALATSYADGGTWPLEKLFFTAEKITSEKELLAKVIREISASKTASLMLKEASDQKWQIGLSQLNGPDFHLDIPEKRIIIESNGVKANSCGNMPYFYHGLQLSLVRALRDVWQEKRHGGFDEEYTPESVLMLERVRAADRDVVAVLCASELNKAGNSGLWKHILGTECSDLAQAFTNNLDKTTTPNPMAASFNQWFRDYGRVNHCDHETLEYMDNVMAAYPGNPFGVKRAGKICIERLSCLPDKNAYLRGQGEEILKAPLYAGLEDSINQNHFLHILRDSQVFIVQDVPFRDARLAEKIFPNGLMTE
ncbi:MAG: DUF6782 family putative metallopeptidase [Alphaproteobacteria bacterium]